MKVLIAGGGTGGHIYPGIAIARYLKDKYEGSEILFVGTQKGLETGIVPKEGFELKLIKVRGFKRKLSVDNLNAVKELLQGMVQARKIIKQFRPDVVIGTGGYVCGPVMFIASRMGIPTLIHESNAFPGITNRILSRYVDAVAVSFKESETFFKSAKRLALTGNPVRSELLKTNRSSARQELKIGREVPLAVIVGGSLGAGKINESVVELLKKFYQRSDCRIIFATGNSQYEQVKKQLEGFDMPSVNILPYIYDTANVYAASDLIVCRAGAITCSELTALGIPAIIIPSPNVTANHQEYNARALENQGAAVVILDKDLNGYLLYKQMTDLLGDREQLAKMARNSKKSGITNAVEKIDGLIQEIINEG